MHRELLILKPQIEKMGGLRFGEDLYQEIWVALLERHAHPRSPSGLAMHIARQKLIDLYRRTSIREKTTMNFVEPATSTNPLDEMIARERLDLILDHCKRLKPIYREVIDAYLRGESLREQATRLDRPIETIRTRFKGAINCLRKSFNLSKGDLRDSTNSKS